MDKNYTARYFRGDYTESVVFTAESLTEADLMAQWNVPDQEGNWDYLVIEGDEEDDPVA